MIGLSIYLILPINLSTYRSNFFQRHPPTRRRAFWLTATSRKTSRLSSKRRSTVALWGGEFLYFNYFSLVFLRWNHRSNQEDLEDLCKFMHIESYWCIYHTYIRHHKTQYFTLPASWVNTNAGETFSLHRSLSSSVVKPQKLEFDCHLSRQGNLSHGCTQTHTSKVTSRVTSKYIQIQGSHQIFREFPCHIGVVHPWRVRGIFSIFFWLMFSWAQTLWGRQGARWQLGTGRFHVWWLSEFHFSGCIFMYFP
jgi:hypothetical protein